MKQITTIILFLIIILTNLVNSANYYIDPVSGSISNDGSSIHPWNTLKDVLLHKTIVDGDILFLRSGFHGYNIFISGVHNAPVTIVAEEGELPFMLGVTVSGSNWIIDNVLFTPEWNLGHEVSAGFDNGRLLTYGLTSTNNIVKNCTFRSVAASESWSIQNWRDKVWSGVRDYGSGNLIMNNHFKNVAYAITAMQQSQGSKVSHNLVEIYSGDGIRNAGANNTVIEYNEVRNAVELDADSHVGNHEDGIQGWGNTQGLIVRGNYIFSDVGDASIPFIAPIQGIVIFDGSTTDAIFENNVVVTAHWHGITVLGSYNSKYINNTILPVPNVVASQGPPYIRVDKKKDGTLSSGNVIRNNITSSLVIDGGSTIDHNYINANVTTLLNDYNNWDFVPKPTSWQLINTGSSDGAPNVDILGVERPQGVGIDIGAYETISELLGGQKYIFKYQLGVSPYTSIGNFFPNDNGIDGDVIAGDGIYSAELTIADANEYFWFVQSYIEHPSGPWIQQWPIFSRDGSNTSWLKTELANQTYLFTYDENTYSDWLPAYPVGNVNDLTTLAHIKIKVGTNHSTLMYDDGDATHGDLLADDGIYSHKTTHSEVGTFVWYVYANDFGGKRWASGGRVNTWTESIEFTVNSTDQDMFFFLNTNTGHLKVQDTPLPVELVTFVANVSNDNNIILQWETATEINNYGFEVERQYHASEIEDKESGFKNLEWKKIGFIEGHGNSNSVKQYSFEDNAFKEIGKYSYRLKQVDIDGMFEYSDIVEVNVGTSNKFELNQNYPNPFNLTTEINFNISSSGFTTLKVFNIIGQEVATVVNQELAIGFHKYNFDANGLTSGIYYYQLQSNGYSVVKKMILMK